MLMTKQAARFLIESLKYQIFANSYRNINILDQVPSIVMKYLSIFLNLGDPPCLGEFPQGILNCDKN